MKSLKIFILVLSAAVMSTFVSCKDDDKEFPTAPALSSSSIEVIISETATVEISGGVSPYKIWGGNFSVTQPSLTNNTISVKGLSAGTSTIYVNSADGGKSTLTVTVKAGTKPKIAPASMSMLVGEQQLAAVSGGKAPYSLIGLSNDEKKIADVAYNSDNLQISVTAKAAGSIFVRMSGANAGIDTLRVTVNIKVSTFTTGSLKTAVGEQGNIAKPENFANTLILEGNTPLNAADYSFLKQLTGVLDFSNYTFDQNATPESCLQGSRMKGVKFPATLTSWGNFSIASCTGLTNAVVPPFAEWYNTFYGCTGITKQIVPDGVVTITETFLGCTALKEVTLPASVLTINALSFKDCQNLTTLTMKGSTPPTLSSMAFDGAKAGFSIVVPKGSLDTYTAAEGWKNYAKQIKESAE